MNRMVKGYIAVILSAIIFGCVPLGAKTIYADGVNSISLVFLRNFLAIPALVLLVKARGESLRLAKGQWKGVLLVSLFGACITPVLLFGSYQYISSGTATTFHFIYPAMVVLGGILFLREKVRVGPLACVLLCTFGVCLFYSPGAAIDPLGSGLALLSGVTYAAYILLLSHCQVGSMSGFKLSLYMAVVCSVIMLSICLATHSLTLPSNWVCWVICIVFSLALCVGAVVLFQQGTFIIGGQRAAILSTFEPITSLIVGVLAFQEHMGPRTLAGAVLVVAAAALIAFFDMRSAKAEAEAQAGV